MRKAAPSAMVLLTALLLSAHAQTAPDAGSLQREADRALQAPRSTIPSAQTAPTAKPMATDAKAARVTVHSITIEGTSLLPVEELNALVAQHIGQSLTLAELEHATQQIAEHYRQQGWYARVYLPQQDVTHGAIRIHILEGRFSGASVQQKGERSHADAVQALITQRLEQGKPLSSADLERGLLLANDLPGIAASGTLQAGQAQGETALAIHLQDTAFITGDVGLNNHGLRATGRAQITGGLALNNMSGNGDQLALRLMVAEDVRSAVARYSLPLGHSGLRLAAHASTLGYELGGSYKALNAEGKAHTGGLTLSYPLVRQADRNLNASLGYEHRRYDDDMLDMALRRHRINAFTLGLSGDIHDNLGAGAITWGSMQLTHGSLNIRDVNHDRTADAATAQSHGSYTKLGWSLSRLQALAPSWQIQANANGQFASSNLASSERMSLGGPHQIRAYPVNEASGDQGMVLQLELQKNLAPGWQAVAFYDVGHIQQHKKIWTGWNTGSHQPNRYTLQGAGLGVSWRSSGWILNASVAVPVGHNPGAVKGRNNDNSKQHSPRGWLSLTRLF